MFMLFIAFIFAVLLQSVPYVGVEVEEMDVTKDKMELLCHKC
jgi:hypothetical protein